MKYDSAIKCISPELSRDIATLILGEAPDLKPISESLPADERRADFLAKIKIAGCEESLIRTLVSDEIRPQDAGTNAFVLREDF